MYVLEFALKMEKIGKDYYEKLADETTVPGIKNIFRMLADDQQELYERFDTMRKNGGGLSMVTSEAFGRPRNIFRTIFNTNVQPVTALKNDLDAYRYALGIEARIVGLFEELAGKERNEEAKALLKKIGEEEKKLYSEIENICDFVAAPTWYPTSIEYSMVTDL